jgi:hypothetical protein
MPLDIRDLGELTRLLQEHPEWREPLRSLLLTEELLALPQRFERLAAVVGESLALQRETLAIVRELALVQERQGEQIRQLAEAQRGTEERLRQNGEQIRQLTEQVQALVTWQRGEAGRRNGERYEREIVRRAPFLFAGGDGGSADQPEVRRRLVKRFGSLLAQDVSAEDDPFLADLLWWKGEQMAVVEVSLQVNGDDVLRASRRAATLRQVTPQVTAVVIGEEWATPHTRERAQGLGVNWKVGADLSAGLLAFRQLPSQDTID